MTLSVSILQIDLHQDDQPYNISPVGISSNTVDDPQLHFQIATPHMLEFASCCLRFLGYVFHHLLDFLDDRVVRGIGAMNFCRRFFFHLHELHEKQSSPASHEPTVGLGIPYIGSYDDGEITAAKPRKGCC